MHAKRTRRNQWMKTIWLPIALAVILGTAWPLAAATTTDPAANQPLKATGHVAGISVAERKINIDGVVYDLARDLVVRDDRGAIMEGYLLKHLSYADEVEFIRLKNVVKEIKVLKLTS